MRNLQMQDLVLWVELALCVVHVAASGALFLRRRNTWPIKRRASSVVLLSIFCVLTATDYLHLDYLLGGFPCVSTLLTHAFATNIVINCLLVRAGRVWFNFFFSLEKARSSLRRTEGTTKTRLVGKDNKSLSVFNRRSSWLSDANGKTPREDVELSIDGGDECSRELEQSNRDEPELSRSMQSCVGGVYQPPPFGSVAWFASYHHLVTEKNMLLAVFGLACVQFVCGPLPAYVIHVQRNNIDITDGPGSFGCAQINPASIAFGVIAAITAFFALWTSIQLRRARDNYAILSELKHFTVTIVATYVLATAIGTAYPLPAQLHIFFGFCQLLTFISLTLPVIRSYSYASQYELAQTGRVSRSGNANTSGSSAHSSEMGAGETRQLKKPSSSRAAARTASSPVKCNRWPSVSELTLCDVLAQPALSRKFLEFLTQEFAVENLQFLRVVEDFEAMVDLDKIDRRALEIYYTFFASTGSLQVNVSSDICLQVRSTFSLCFDPFPLLISSTTRGRRPRIHVVNDKNLARTDTHEGGVQSVYLHRRSHVPISTFTRARKQIVRLLKQDSFLRFRRKMHKFGNLSGDFNSNSTEVAGKFYGPYNVRVILEVQHDDACDAAMNNSPESHSAVKVHHDDRNWLVVPAAAPAPHLELNLVHV